MQEFPVNIVRCGDALFHLNNLPDKSVGAIITDPPFFCNIGRNSGPTGGFGVDPWENGDGTIESVSDWATAHAIEFARITRRGGAIVIMAGVHAVAAWMHAAEKAGLIWMAELMVLWNTGKPRKRNFGSLHTHILWFTVPGARHTWNSDHHSIYSNILVADKVPIQDRLHPAQKPIELTTFLISLLTKPGDVVVDPFCGSGSTLISAVIVDRPYIGIDLSKQNCDITRRRVRNWEFEEESEIHLWINGRLERV